MFVNSDNTPNGSHNKAYYSNSVEQNMQNNQKGNKTKPVVSGKTLEKKECNNYVRIYLGKDNKNADAQLPIFNKLQKSV